MPTRLTELGRFPMVDGRLLGGFPRCARCCPEGVLIGGGLGLHLHDPATLELRRAVFEGGRVLRLSRCFDGQVYAVVAGAGRGEGLATGTGLRVLRIPLDGGAPAKVMDLPGAMAPPIEADPTGTLYTSTTDGELRRLPLEGPELEPLQAGMSGHFGRTEPLQRVAVSPSGDYFAAAAGDWTVLLWDKRGKKRARIGHRCEALAVNDEGVLFLGGSRVRAFGADGAELAEGEGVLSPDALRLSPDGTRLAIANHWGQHVLLRWPGLEALREVREHSNTGWTGWTYEIADLDDAHLVQISDRYGWIRSWAHGEEAPAAEQTGITWGVASMGVGGERVAWSTPNPESLRLMDGDGRLRARGFATTAGPEGVSLDPLGETVLLTTGTFGTRKTAALIRFSDGEELESFQVRADADLASFSPDGALYALGLGGFEGSGEVLIRAPGSSRAKKRVKDSEGGPLATCWRPDGQALAIAWRAGAELVPMAKGGASGRWALKRPAAIAVAPDDRVVVAMAWEPTLQVMGGGAVTLPSKASALLFSDDGETLWAGLEDGQILAFDAAFELKGALRAHTAAITALISRAGALWSSSEDGTIRRWAV